MLQMCKTALQIKHEGFYYVIFHMCLILTFIHILKTFECSSFVLTDKPIFWIMDCLRTWAVRRCKWTFPSATFHRQLSKRELGMVSMSGFLEKENIAYFKFCFPWADSLCIIKVSLHKCGNQNFALAFQNIHSLVSGSSCALLLNWQICSKPALLSSVCALLQCTNDRVAIN